MTDVLIAFYTGGALATSVILRPPREIWRYAWPIWVLTAVAWPVAAWLSSRDKA